MNMLETHGTWQNPDTWLKDRYDRNPEPPCLMGKPGCNPVKHKEIARKEKTKLSQDELGNIYFSEQRPKSYLVNVWNWHCLAHQISDL